mmetsp:Transcript_15063/g.29339  ORF Transcript_15063/g.29339 Transcript_15063/m.29339 type:complete len:217 (+) Transcript_15063:509-1159(+)
MCAIWLSTSWIRLSCCSRIVPFSSRYSFSRLATRSSWFSISSIAFSMYSRTTVVSIKPSQSQAKIVQRSGTPSSAYPVLRRASSAVSSAARRSSRAPPSLISSSPDAASSSSETTMLSSISSSRSSSTPFFLDFVFDFARADLGRVVAFFFLAMGVAAPAGAGELAAFALSLLVSAGPLSSSWSSSSRPASIAVTSSSKTFEMRRAASTCGLLRPK